MVCGTFVHIHLSCMRQIGRKSPRVCRPLPSDLTVVETVVAVVVTATGGTVVAVVVTATGGSVVAVVVTATGGTVVAVVFTATGGSCGNQWVIELKLTLCKSVYTAKGCYWCSYMYSTISL